MRRILPNRMVFFDLIFHLRIKCREHRAESGEPREIKLRDA
jgi:hypothetical protein